MSRLWLVAVVFVIVFAAAQLVRPAHLNPPIDAARTLQARIGTANGVVALLDRSCATATPTAARLSVHEVETICGAARLAAAQVSR